MWESLSDQTAREYNEKFYHAFLYISLPNFTLYRGRTQASELGYEDDGNDSNSVAIKN